MEILKRIYEWAVVLLAFLLLFITLMVGYLTFLEQSINPMVTFYDPFLKQEINPVTNGGITHLVENKSYYPGEVVWATVNATKYRNIVVSIQWQLKNHRTYTYPPRPGALPSGHNIRLVKIEKLPDVLEPGIYWFEGLDTSTGICPPISVQNYRMRTNEFEVVSDGRQ